MIHFKGSWPGISRPLLLTGLWLASTVPLVTLGQEGPKNAQPPVAGSAARDQIIARLKEACESDPGLHGSSVQGGELRDGALRLHGTIDRREQADRLEAEARRLLAEEPAWKKEASGGVSASNLVLFPIRSELLPKLRRQFSQAGEDAVGRPNLLRQTRLDDIYFDHAGRLRIAGLCINQGAFLARHDASTNPTNDPLNLIAQGVDRRLKGYTLPAGVDADIIGRLQADRITFSENPARLLQRFVNESHRLDDVLFQEAWFDESGSLKFAGLVGTESQRADASALLSRPEFLETYSRAGNAPPGDPKAAVAEMTESTWRPTLLAGLQKRFADDSNLGTPLADLRYCRIDRAFFVYPELGGLLLRFEGIALLGSERSGQIATALRDESRRLFRPSHPVDYNVEERLTKLSNPRRELQAKVSATPSLDGVRIDDLVFGPQGEPTVWGVWLNPSQATGLGSVLKPTLENLTWGRVNGSLAWRMDEVPTDKLLHDLRGKVAAKFDETSLDRLFFQLPADSKADAVLTLQGTTLSPRRRQIEAQLRDWLKGNDLVRSIGTPTLSLGTWPGSLLAELRKLVTRDTTLDGLRVDHAAFDADNQLVLSGLQGYDGQSDRLIPLALRSAAVAWPNLPNPLAVRSGGFTTVPLGPLLDRLARLMPDYPEADGLMFTRAFYDVDQALVLVGRTAGGSNERPNLVKEIKSVLAADSKLEIRLSLTTQPRDPELAAHLVGRSVDALAEGSISCLGPDPLNQAIFLNPEDSTAWYVRAAYHLTLGDREQAARDMRRVRALEGFSPDRARIRRLRLTRFQGPLRASLGELEASVTPGP